MQAEASCQFIWRDATQLGVNNGPEFDLIFLDPPYGKKLGEAALASLRKGGWMAPDALLVWEEGSVPKTPPGFDQLDQRKYGDTWVTILQALA
jgi:16S rRNA (guanine966-N2)-methyltransferase